MQTAKTLCKQQKAYVYNKKLYVKV